MHIENPSSSLDLALSRPSSLRRHVGPSKNGVGLGALAMAVLRHCSEYCQSFSPTPPPVVCQRLGLLNLSEQDRKFRVGKQVTRIVCGLPGLNIVVIVVLGARKTSMHKADTRTTESDSRIPEARVWSVGAAGLFVPSP